jgi:hypothetical protein
VPPGAVTPRIGSPVGGILDSRSDAMVGHRLVIEARDDAQVGVQPALIVPAERVAVGSEPLCVARLAREAEVPVSPSTPRRSGRRAKLGVLSVRGRRRLA